MIVGIACALAAGLMWGVVFVAPVLLPEYSAASLTFGRYLAFGLITLALALPDLAALRSLTRVQWLEAVKLALVGNIAYYLFVAAAIQSSGVPLVSVIIGTLPVVIAVCGNLGHGALPWSRLLPSVLVLAAGIAAINLVEVSRLAAGAHSAYAQGALLAVFGVVCWTWYPLRNARFLACYPAVGARLWATAQGLATLPFAAAGMAWVMLFAPLPGGALGPKPLEYVGLMFFIGLTASWLGTLAWNAASKRLPASLSGQLIVFETLAALAYGFLHRGAWPSAVTLFGIALLVVGVVLGVRAFQRNN
jgi:drug/metabolite transporter (DMT)-like permease